MGNNKIITLVDGYREIGEVELICAFKIPEFFGKYIIYTKNEFDKDGNTIIYAGKVITIDNKQFIENINEGSEWERLKEIMKSMAKYSLEGENNV
jgi:uncharacterized protein YrzB (UPF0473 family)